jgi:hypothetical protein
MHVDQRTIDETGRDAQLSPTDAANFEERLRVTRGWIFRLLRRGNIQKLCSGVPHGTVQEIETKWDEGASREACRLLDKLFEDLGRVGRSSGGDVPRYPFPETGTEQRPQVSEDVLPGRDTTGQPSIPISTGRVPFEDSPFGFLGPVSGNPRTYWEDYTHYLEDLQIHWVRNGGLQGLRWGDVEPHKGSPYRWNKYDTMVRALQDADTNLVFCILPVAQRGESDHGFPPKKRGRGFRGGGMEGNLKKQTGFIKLPADLAAYERFVQAVVERYDGDGVRDMPGLKFPLKYWMTSHEPDHPFFWHDSPENYAILVRYTCASIKKADPEAKVILAGTAGQMNAYIYRHEEAPNEYDTRFPGHGDTNEDDGFFIRFFRKLQDIAPKMDEWIDILDFHIFMDFGDYERIERYVHYINRIARDFGLSPKPIWITETSTFAGRVTMKRRTFQEGAKEYQSEREQAQELLKRYVFGLAHGVRKIFWDGPVSAGGESFFGLGGIVHENGEYLLSYYTYKKMVEKLAGSDWNNVETIDTGIQNINVIKFVKKNTRVPVYVAWWDFYKEGEKSGAFGRDFREWRLRIDSPQVKITHAIPYAESGADIRDYKSAFRTETLPVRGSSITIPFRQDPFFIEPSQ